MNGPLPLVDVLRQQVAHLVREQAERDTVLHERTRHLRVARPSLIWVVGSGKSRAGLFGARLSCIGSLAVNLGQSS